MAQLVEQVSCLRCHFDSNSGYDCNKCPIKNRGFFEICRNYNSTGSRTPHTNIDYSTFDEIKTFFNKIGIKLKDDKVNELKSIIKDVGVSFPYNIYPNLKAKTIAKLKSEGCTWI